MEKMDMDLLEYTTMKERLNEEEAKHVFREICCGVEHCHSLGIAHLDLKADNVLIRLDQNNNNNNGGMIRDIKLCDFGSLLAVKESV